MKFIFLSGSIRKGSFNTQVALHAYHYAQNHHPESGSAFIDLDDYPMPIFNQDLEADHGLPATAQSLKAMFKHADGFFISCPEYNSSYPALLKNTIDWVSRQEDGEEKPLLAFENKIFAVASASVGKMGGVRAQKSLITLFENIGAKVVPSTFTLANASEAFNDDGNFKDDEKSKELYKLVDALLNMNS